MPDNTIQILFYGLYVIPILISCIWVFGDAKRRGKSTLISFIISISMIFLAWPFSIIGWFLFRPNIEEKKDQS